MPPTTNADNTSSVPRHNEATKDSHSPVHLNLPVGLSCYIDIVQVSCVVLRIGPTQHQLSPHFCLWVSTWTGRTEKKHTILNC